MNFKLWLLERRIAHLENHERQLASELSYISRKLLPSLRDQRNKINFPEKSHGAQAVYVTPSLPRSDSGKAA